MPLTRANTRTFHRHLYAGWYQTITLLKRGNDQQQGQVTPYTLYYCLGKRIPHTGEPIQGNMASGDRRNWLIPAVEMERVGLDANNWNALDRIVDEKGRYWQPEAPDNITIQLGGNYLNIDCRRVDP